MTGGRRNLFGDGTQKRAAHLSKHPKAGRIVSCKLEVPQGKAGERSEGKFFLLSEDRGPRRFRPAFSRRRKLRTLSDRPSRRPGLTLRDRNGGALEPSSHLLSPRGEAPKRNE